MRIQILTGLSVGAALIFFAPIVESSTNPPCVKCELLAKQQAMSPSAIVLSPTSSDNVNQGLNVASILNHTNSASQNSPIQFPAQTAPTLPAGQTWWNGQGELPGSFQMPWTFAPSNFNPTFVTPYYNAQQGVINNSSAPWNYAPSPGFGTPGLGSWQGLAPTFAPPSLDMGLQI